MPERLARLGLERKVRLLTGADFWALHAEPAVGLRRIVTSDGPAGVRGERWDEREPSANAPSPTALAATWDEARVERLGGLLAAECRRKGVDVLLAPTINLHRTPFAGRHFECLSEDPLLTGRIGAALVRGLQAAGVAATVKHFVANDSETERMTLDARIGARALRELYLAPFEAIVRGARPWAVMAAYNSVNGHTMTESPLLTDVLEGEWGFDGVVMSDWFAARSTAESAGAALDLVMPGPDGPWGEALVAAVRAGRVPEAAVDRKLQRLLRLAERVGALDGAQPAATAPWPPESVAAELRAAAAASFVLARNTGELLPLDRRALRRVAVVGPNAAVARTLGGGSATVFPPYAISPVDGLRAALGDGAVVHGAGVTTRSRLPAATAAELRGDAELRFLGDGDAVLATERRAGGGYAWHGAFPAGVDATALRAVEVRARVGTGAAGEHVVGASGAGRFRLELDGRLAFDERLAPPPDADPGAVHMRPPQRGVPVTLPAGGSVDVVLRHDVEQAIVAFQLNVEPPRRPDDEEIARAAELAAGADAAIVVVGTTEEVESESFDRETLALPGRQDELVRRVAAANPRTVVVVNAGAPVLMPWLDDVPAVLLTWFGGQELGHALADVLLGEREPGGRLPTTWPAGEDGLPSARPVDGALEYAEGIFVGHRARGGPPALLPFGHGLGYTGWEYGAIEPDGGDGVRVRLRNRGPRPGREVVQVYASRGDGAVERPPRWLAGYAAVEAPAGAEVEVRVELPRRSFEHWDERAGAFVLEPGAFDVAAGRSAGDLRCATRLTPA